MAKFIHNLTETEKMYQGQTVAANSYLPIQENLLGEFRSDLSLLADLISGEAKMSVKLLRELKCITSQARIQFFIPHWAARSMHLLINSAW